MSSYFVCMRFFLGYTASFQFDRFLLLKDDEVGPAVEAMAKEWWSKPSNRTHFQQLEAERLEKHKKWLQAGLAMPNGHSFVQIGTRYEVEPHVGSTGTPTVNQIAVTAGWGSPALCGRYGITHRYPVARYSTKELANVAATALEGRVAELARSTETKASWSDSDQLLATASPQFLVVPESQLSLAEQIAFRDRLERVNTPLGENTPLEEGLVRFFLPRLRSTLDQLRESEVQHAELSLQSTTLVNEPIV
jgi:hypothetical protein